MTDHPPGPHAVMGAVSTLQRIAAKLRELCPDIEDDEKLFADTLEGEAPDAVAVIDRLIDASIGAADLAEMAQVRLTELAERKARFERRRDAYRAVALEVMTTLNLKRLERPAWTVSLRQQPAALIVDDDILPDPWWREKREPNRADIRRALLAGCTIKGAQLGNPQVGLSVRTR